MTGKTFEIQVHDDHLVRIAQTRKPILALAELIWNAVDADATHIDITLIYNDLDGLDGIKVADNGHGIPLSSSGGFILASGWVMETIMHPLHRRKTHSPR